MSCFHRRQVSNCGLYGYSIPPVMLGELLNRKPVRWPNAGLLVPDKNRTKHHWAATAPQMFGRQFCDLGEVVQKGRKMKRGLGPASRSKLAKARSFVAELGNLDRRRDSRGTSLPFHPHHFPPVQHQRHEIEPISDHVTRRRRIRGDDGPRAGWVRFAECEGGQARRNPILT
jgi:hypothetical protein